MDIPTNEFNILEDQFEEVKELLKVYRAESHRHVETFKTIWKTILDSDYEGEVDPAVEAHFMKTIEVIINETEW
eukprot:CAMPEP_0116927178 /NCGR_PEP_ID=MMETSP0467-20121206/25188_1 /TAXON_ID=283647 /ORGANISM="Mesodinium pulex, Strain SPMC105" /LENGTH=73 /DNA_ID=CAMNT_0004606621 /DNA_START=678 /DNA_END=899 /DNA_ORIENTATION=-